MNAVGIALCIVALLLATLVAQFARSPSKGAIFFAGLAIFPFFLKVAGHSLQLGDVVYASGSGQTFPFSLIAEAAFGSLVFFHLLTGRLRVRRSPLIPSILLLALVNMVAAAFGMLEKPQLANLLFFCQTIAPIPCFFIALNFISTTEQAQSALLLTVATIGAFIIALGLYTAHQVGVARMITEGLGQDLLGIFNLYCLYDYIPLVVAVGYGLGLGLLLGRTPDVQRSWLAPISLSLLIALLFLHSKGALVTAGVMTVVLCKQFGQNARAVMKSALLGLAAGTILVVICQKGNPFTLQYYEYFLASGAADESLQGRLNAHENALNSIGENPLFGLGYVAQEIDGRANMRNPHNMYLTYAIRGGILSAALFVWIAISACRRLYLLGQHAASPPLAALGKGLFGVLCSVCITSNLLQDNFIQPYSGCLLWFLLGLGESLWIINRGFTSRRSSADARNAHSSAVAVDRV